MPAPNLILPYCGAPPLPDSLWSRWNLDPILIAALVALLAAYLVGQRRIAASGREARLFAVGWAVLAAALISPLCALSVALFSARVGQHMLIALIAIPLIVLGRPFARYTALLPLLRYAAPAAEVLANKVVATVLFAAFLWMWHTPYFYAATFRGDLVYWTMHLTMAGSAFLLWHGLLTRGLAEPLLAFGAGFATTMQMSLLGAMLTFATRPLFAEHLLTSTPFGLQPIEDQQFGGLLMWIPGCTVLVVAGLVLLAQFMQALEQRQALAPAAPGAAG